MGHLYKKPFEEIKKFAIRISTHWTKAAQSIIKVAVICHEANDELDADEKKDLFKLLPFSQSTFSKLAQIGADQRLTSPAIQELLPPNYSTIYLIGQLNNNELSTAVNDGVIKPARADFISWTEKYRGAVQSTAPTLHPSTTVLFADVRIDGTITDREFYELQQILDIIKKDYNVLIRTPHDDYEQKVINARARHASKVDRKLRDKVKQIVEQNVARNLKGVSSAYAKASSEVRRKLSGFEFEEVTFDDLEDIRDECQRLLEIHGHDDEYQRLLEETYENTEIKLPIAPYEIVSDPNWINDYEIKIVKHSVKKTVIKRTNSLNKLKTLKTRKAP